MPSHIAFLEIPHARRFTAGGILLLTLFAAGSASAQFETPRPRVVDPPNPFHDYVSLAEFNADGDAEGWAADAQTAETGVVSGAWRGVSGFDTKLSKPGLNIPGAGGDNVLEFRLKRSDSDNSNIQVFWADDAGSFAEPQRVITILPEFVPQDGEFHIYRLYLGSHVTGNLQGLRIDASDNEGVELLFDYIRFGGKSVIVDPPAAGRLNAYTSLAEFNTKADFQGWTVNDQVNNAHVADGALKALSFGADAQLLSANALNVDTTAASRDFGIPAETGNGRSVPDRNIL